MSPDHDAELGDDPDASDDPDHQMTVRDVLAELDVDPADLDSVADLQTVVDIDISADGDPVESDDLARADVLEAPVTVESNRTPTGLIRQSTSDYPPDWDRRRKNVYDRDDYQCQNCRRRGGPYGDVVLHAHRIVPKARGGVHRSENLITLCEPCHDAVHSRYATAPTALTDDEAEPSVSKILENWAIVPDDSDGL